MSHIMIVAPAYSISGHQYKKANSGFGDNVCTCLAFFWRFEGQVQKIIKDLTPQMSKYENSFIGP